MAGVEIAESLVRAAEAAGLSGAQVIALTGSTPNRLAEIADLAVQVPSIETPIVQEVHLMLTHLICGIIEDEMSR